MLIKGWCARRGAGGGGVPPVEGQRSRDKTKGKVQVAPPGGYVMNQCRHLADRACTSGRPLTDTSRTSTVQIRASYF